MLENLELFEIEENKPRIFNTIDLLCSFHFWRSIDDLYDPERPLEHFEENEVTYLIRRIRAIWSDSLMRDKGENSDDVVLKYINDCIDAETDPLIKLEYSLVRECVSEMITPFTENYDFFTDENDNFVDGIQVYIASFFPYKYKKEIEDYVAESMNRAHALRRKDLEEDYEELKRVVQEHIDWHREQEEIIFKKHEVYAVEVDDPRINIINKFIVRESNRVVQHMLSKISFTDIAYLTIIVSPEADMKIRRNVSARLEADIENNIKYGVAFEKTDNPKEFNDKIKEIIDAVAEFIKNDEG